LFAGKIISVKNMVLYFLIGWLALMSGGANAHTTTSAEHLAVHAHDLVSQDGHEHKPQAEVVIQAPTTQDANYTDCCSQTHCENCHATYLLAPEGTRISTDRFNAAPISRSSFASSAVTANIERPKWSYTTSAVVNLLG